MATLADLEKITRKRLGELLLAEGLINQDQLAQALKVQERTGELVGEALVKLGYTTETEIAKALCTQFAKPFIKPSRYDIAKEVLTLLPPKLMAEHLFVPIDRFGDLLVVAMGGVLEAATVAEVQKLTSCDLELFISTASDVKNAIRKHFPDLYDPITLQPTFDRTSAVTAAVRVAPPDPDDDGDFDETRAKPRKGKAAAPQAMGAITAAMSREARDLGSTPTGAEDEDDWEALFEEAEQNVMRSLHPEEGGEATHKVKQPKKK